MDSNPIDRVRSLVAGHGHALMADLLKSNAAPRAEAASLNESGWSVLVLAFPCRPAEGTPGLTQCDRDVITLLGQAPEPLPASRIRKDLEQVGIGVYGIATVKRSLARLLRLGIVANSKRTPRGYYLPETLPLVRRAARA
jgi:hypothetical protein